MLSGQCLAVHAETTATFQVSATIASGCVVMGATNVTSGDVGSFGTLDFDTAPALSQDTVMANIALTSGITIRCTPGTSLRMTIDGGLHASNGLRHVATADGAQVAYRVRLSPYTAAFVGLNESNAIALNFGALSYVDFKLPIHGVLDLPGNVHGGDYTDTLQVTLAW